MQIKKIMLPALTVAGLGSLLLGAKKIANEQKQLRTQEAMVKTVRTLFCDKGVIETFYVELYQSNLERLVGGVFFEDGRHYRFIYEQGKLDYQEKEL